MSDKARQSFLDVLGAADRQNILNRSRIVRAHRGQVVLARGEASTDVYLVQEGRLQVVLYAADGREVLLRDLKPGQLFGELSAIDETLRSVGIMATGEARLLAIPQMAFREILAASPEVNAWMLQRLASQVRNLTGRVFELSALNVQARLHCELLRIANSVGQDSEPAPTHEELANRIGTNRESVTRELNSLASRNLIRVGRRRLEFLDLPGLEREVRAILRTPIVDEGWW